MGDSLALLPDADLLALAAALRSGRLAPPFTPASVSRFCGGEHAAAAAAGLHTLAEEGMAPRHLALLLEAAAQARGWPPSEGRLLDLVWTGPEAPGRAIRDTGVVVRELFRSARATVLVVGYAVYQGRDVFRALTEQMVEVPTLRVRLFLDVRRQHGDDAPDEVVLSRFAQRFRESEWPGETMPEVFYDPRSLAMDAAKRSSLHAKCVVIDEETAFVSSANFTEAAQVRNIEVGVLVRSPMFATRLSQQFETLTALGLLQPLRIVP
jgi:hypothetical protein